VQYAQARRICAGTETCDRFAVATRLLLRGSMMAWVLGVAPVVFCCTEEAPLGPPGQNVTGPVTSGSVVEGDSEDSETGTPGDMQGCDPLADPVSECGVDMVCDLFSNTCEPAFGSGGEDDPCATDDECEPGLICASNRCRPLCDAALDEGCADTQVCAAAVAPIPGVCLDRCLLVTNSCEFPGDACKRVLGAAGLVAACIPNPGFGAQGEACDSDPECAPGNLCTPAADHALPCANEAPSCCAPICDTRELPCFGFEPVCYTLALADQPNAGYCGAE